MIETIMNNKLNVICNKIYLIENERKLDDEKNKILLFVVLCGIIYLLLLNIFNNNKKI